MVVHQLKLHVAVNFNKSILFNPNNISSQYVHHKICCNSSWQKIIRSEITNSNARFQMGRQSSVVLATSNIESNESVSSQVILILTPIPSLLLSWSVPKQQSCLFFQNYKFSLEVCCHLKGVQTLLFDLLTRRWSYSEHNYFAGEDVPLPNKYVK